MGQGEAQSQVPTWITVSKVCPSKQAPCLWGMVCAQWFQVLQGAWGRVCLLPQGTYSTTLQCCSHGVPSAWIALPDFLIHFQSFCEAEFQFCLTHRISFFILHMKATVFPLRYPSSWHLSGVPLHAVWFICPSILVWAAGSKALHEPEILSFLLCFPSMQSTTPSRASLNHRGTLIGSPNKLFWGFQPPDAWAPSAGGCQGWTAHSPSCPYFQTFVCRRPITACLEPVAKCWGIEDWSRKGLTWLCLWTSVWPGEGKCHVRF